MSAPEIKICGAISYDSAMRLMNEARADTAEKKIPGKIFILEHNPPVITLGRNRGENSILSSPEEISLSGYEIVRAGRGGDATVHEPGQAVIYIVQPVNGKNSSAFVEGWCSEISSFLSDEYGVTADYSSRMPGLFVEERKIASVGFDLTGGVSSHGIAVNVCNTLAGFEFISPCGYRSAVMTTLSRELGRQVEFCDFAERLRDYIFSRRG